MLLCCGVTYDAETLVIAQSFWFVLAEKKNCGYSALVVINRSTSLHFMPLPLAQSKHGDQYNQKLGSFPTNEAKQHAPKKAQFFSFGGGRVWMGFFCNLMFPNVYHMIPSCFSRSQFVPQVPNSDILYPISTFAQIPNYIGSTKKILHYVYFRSGNICFQHLHHQAMCMLYMIYFRGLPKWALGVQDLVVDQTKRFTLSPLPQEN